MYDWETFQTAYHAATDDQRATIDSNVIPRCVAQVVEQHHLDASHQRRLTQLQSRYVLGVLSQEQVTAEMLQLGVPEGNMVFAALQTCLTNPPAPTAEDLEDEIAATEAALEATPATLPVRTMASDMAAATGNTPSQAGETVYTSTQEALLREAKPATQPNATPTPVTAQSQNSQLPTSVHPPRWDSEQ